MMPIIDEVIDPFAAAASEAHRKETAFVKEFDAELARHRRAREFAYRRLGLVRDLAKSAYAAADGACVGRQLEVLRTELGWHDCSAHQERVIEAFRQVAEAIGARFVAGTEQGGASVASAFGAFEDWYEKETGRPFLALLDHEIPELPLVDF